MPREVFKKQQPIYKNEQCETFSHIGADGSKIMKPKQKYETDKEAIEKARYLNSLPDAIHKSVAYKCHTCGKWHVGRTAKELTDKEKEHYSSLGKPKIYTRLNYQVDIEECNFKRVIPSAELELIIKKNLGL